MAQIEQRDAFTGDTRIFKRGPLARPATTRPGAATKPRTAASIWAYARAIRNRSFLLCVVLPTALAFIYLQFFATREYVTDFQFTILPQNVAQSGSSATPSAASAGQSAVTAGSGGGSGALLTVMDNMVITYLQSQQAVLDTEKNVDLKKLFDNDKIDPLQRFWWNNGSFERMTDYWRLFVVNASYDTATGLCDVQVKAFTPQDSERIATTLARLSEQLINNQSLRQRQDTVAYAEKSFKDAQARMDKSLAAEQQFRRTHESIDPSVNGTNNLTLQAALQGNLATLQAQRDALLKVSPGAPALSLLDSQIQSTQAQLTKVTGNVGSGDVSSGSGSIKAPIATSMQDFEAIEAEKNFATQNYTANLQNLTSANFEAVQQQFYLQPFVEPTTPQYPLYPQPLLGSLLVFGCTFVVWGIFSLFYQGSKQHV